ncbi:putative fatty acyl-CoA reductase CG5065 [Hetaerina americana]|uniref:putative fatty acyl-CoA reductase CG5065 n=1 Tax=Hetaerina americana TaxID=62018 RepID=UPI003A7F2517
METERPLLEPVRGSTEDNAEGVPEISTAAMNSPICNFFDGRSVLMTGATGFLGKALMMKLLKSCPGLKKIYVIVRAKKGKEPKERIRTLLEDKAFRGCSEELASKVVAMSGDISLPGLDLSPEDTQKLIGADITVAFHSAATVRFNEPLKGAIEKNVGGTQAIIELCKQFKDMKVLVYVSTAYSNCNLPKVEETVYDSAIPAEGFLQCARWMSEKQMEALAPQVMGSWPNSYTFSKFLAENLLKAECGHFSVAIFRPTIVVNAVKEPVPGWTNSFNGPTGVTLASGVGLVRTICCDEDLVVDIVPVDWVVNAAITSAWDASHKEKDISIYNYSSGSVNPITWKEYVLHCEEFGHKYPPGNALWYYSLTMTKKKWLYYLLRLLLHIWPALLVDFTCSLLGKPKRMLHIYEKVDEFADLSSFFTMNQWKFSDQNVQSMLSRVSAEDSKIFPCNIQQLNWKNYFNDYMYGIRQFLLKEDPKTIPASIIRVRRLKVLHRGVQVALFIFLIFITYTMVSSIYFIFK